MSIRLQVGVDVSADPATVWDVMTDWAGQADWIPFTQVDVRSAHTDGLGVRAEALSGFRLGGRPIGLLDRFVVTGWLPPTDRVAGELEVLHLGPYFTGEGVFRLEPIPTGTRVVCTEVFSVPGGALSTSLVGLGLPVMRQAFRRSLTKMARIAEQRTA